MTNNKVVSNKLFYCEHLFERKNILEELKRDFYIYHESGMGLDIYLKEMSVYEEKNNENRTYIVRDIYTDEIVGYFSLKAGLFSLEEKTDVLVDKTVSEFETLPGIELAEFAVNQKYISLHPEKKGCGLIIFNELIVPIVKTAQEIIGVKVLYIFALPEQRLIDMYTNDYYFQRLDKCDEDNLHSRMKPRFDYGCIFMYQLI